MQEDIKNIFKLKNKKKEESETINVSTKSEIDEILRKKLIKARLPYDILNEKYFSLLRIEDIRTLILFDNIKLKDYLVFIAEMHKIYEFTDQDEKQLNRVSNIVYGLKDRKMKERVKELLLNNLFSYDNNLEEFIYEYIQIKDELKLNAIDEVINNNSLKTIDLLKIIKNIKIVKNRSQIICLKDLFQRIENSEKLDKLVNIVIKNSKNKYLNYIIKLIDSNKLDSCMIYLADILSSSNIKQAEVIYKLVIIKDKFKDENFKKVLTILKSTKNVSSFPYIECLLEKVDEIDYRVFEKILYEIMITENDLHKKAILSLIEYKNIIKSPYKLEDTILKISKCQEEFQIISVIDLINNDNYINDELLEYITRSKTDYQIECLVKTYNVMCYNKNIFEQILNIKNELVCKYIPYLFKLNIPTMLIEKTFADYISLNKEYQFKAFLNIYSIPSMFETKLDIINSIKNGNELQLQYYTKLLVDNKSLEDIDKIIYLNNIFKYNDYKRVKTIGEILCNFDKLGKEKIITLLSIIDKYQDRKEEICDIILESLENGILHFESFNKDRIEDYLLNRLNTKIKFYKKNK